ncbi:uncharacterized protein LOC113319057 isoform X2 [Papaver somniferum]|uniref:uncharacterized protein LOC113319057 isoform X2 n=1 Tax=Papaver somniferum TaxID=3469 RepID=UPI000E7038FE|nr:uncharacterized protein LOC113319057 isoform X2 [Papaver somniferum]
MKPKPRSTFVNRQRAKEISADAVNERLNAVAPKKNRSSTIKPSPAFINGAMGKEIMTDAEDDRLDAVTRKRQRTSTTVPCYASFISTDAVDERLEPVTLKRHRSKTAPCSLVSGQRGKEIVTDAMDERISAVALEKQRSSTTNQDSAFVNGRRENEIVTDVEDEGINAADESGDMQLEDDHATDTHNESNSEDYTGTNPGIICRPLGDMQDADENGEMQLEDDHATDTHNEFYSKDYTGINPGVTYRLLGSRHQIIFDKYGRYCDVGSEQFANAIGKIVRARCPPAIDDWRMVPEIMKDDIWKNLVADYVIPQVSKPNILSRARISWKNWKSQLRVEMDKHETVAEKKRNMPERLITNREDWEHFVDFCNTEEDRKRRTIGKKSREALQFLHSTGRTGLFRKKYDMEKESPTGEVNRAVLFVETHVTKTLNNPESSSISDVKLRKMKELVDADPNGQKDIDNDAVTLICGRDRHGHVRGMGGGLSRTTMRASAPIIETLRKVRQENKSMQSEIHLFKTQHGTRMQDGISTSSNQSAPQVPDEFNVPAISSNVPASLCFMKNFKGRTIALGRLNTADPAMEHVYSIIVEEIFDRDAELFDEDGKLGDIVIGGVINWPKACIKPASLCFLKNFKGRTIALGSYNSVDPPMEHVYSVKVEEIFDEESELFDEDGKLGDIMIGDVINWPKACVQSY